MLILSNFLDAKYGVPKVYIISNISINQNFFIRFIIPDDYI